MKGEVKLPTIILIGTAIVVLLSIGIFKVLKSGDLDDGSVKYTPGVPPWMDASGKSKGANAPDSQGHLNGPQATAPAGR